MRKYAAALVLVAGVIVSTMFAGCGGEAANTPLDYARITQVDYTAELVDEPGGDGKIIVTERLTFDIHAASKDNLFWELWRDLPEKYVDGVKVGYKVNSVKQLFADGSELVYAQSPRLYWDDYDYIDTAAGLGPGKWFHSEGPYSEYLRQYECVLFYVDGLYRERAVFEIEYEMSNAALRYNDCSELYITPYSEGSINYLTSFKGQILVPDDIMPGAGNYEAHTYGTNAHTFPFIESDDANPGYHTFAFELGRPQLRFRPYNQYLEFTFISYGEDRHIFTKYASVNDYYNDDVLAELHEEHAKYMALATQYKIAKAIVLAVCSGAALLTLLAAFGIHKRMKKKYTFYEPAMQFDYFRDIPGDLDPNFAAVLVFCKHRQPKDTQDSYAAVMLNLVRKGYIELARIRNERGWDSANVMLIVKYDPSRPQNAADVKPLTPAELQYFNLIARHANGGDLPLRTFQQKVSADYENTNSFVRNIKNSVTAIGVAQGYFQKAEYRQAVKQVNGQSWALGVIGVLVMLAGNLVSCQTRLDLAFGAFFILGAGFVAAAVYLRTVSKKYVLLTQFGEDEYAKWRGLYNFLNSSTLLDERTVIELALWEQYLVYATAFGIADKVIAALNVRCPYTAMSPTMSPMLYNPYYRTAFFYSGGRSFHSATRTASVNARSASYSSGYGGHGGYGGGGRGGGGGGGGH